MFNKLIATIVLVCGSTLGISMPADYDPSHQECSVDLYCLGYYLPYVEKHESGSSSKSKARIKAIKSQGMEVGAAYGSHYEANYLNEQFEEIAGKLDQIINYELVMRLNSADKIVANLLPPVIDTSSDNVAVSNNGKKYGTNTVTYKIRQPARMVTIAPSWRDFIITSPTRLDDVKTYITPKSEAEQKAWKNSYYRGFVLGQTAVEKEVIYSINELARNYFGMIEYLILNKQGYIKDPKITSNYVPFYKNDKTLGITNNEYNIAQDASFDTNPNDWQIVSESKSSKKVENSLKSKVNNATLK